MTPALTSRGRTVTLIGTMFMVAGAMTVTWPLIVLGGLLLSALLTCMLLFHPTAVLLRKKQIELAWWIDDERAVATGPRPLVVGSPVQLQVALRNYGPTPISLTHVEIFCGRGLELELPPPWKVPSSTERKVAARLRSIAAGNWALHGLFLEMADPLGWLSIRAYFPNPLMVKVLPRASVQPLDRRAGAAPPILDTSATRIGPRTVRRRGTGDDLREIRPLEHGDAFKQIAWKATARTRKLMVRELESNLVMTHVLVLAAGPTLRRGAIGRTGMDLAVETATTLARRLLNEGDRVGLIITTDGAPVVIAPKDTQTHWLAILDALLQNVQPFSASDTDLSPGEVVATVARYVREQEGIDVRTARPAALDDPAWAKLAVGPTGELYQLEALLRVVDTLAIARPVVAHFRLAVPTAQPLDRDPQIARLRLFAKERGIELSPRIEDSVPREVVRLAAALEQAVDSSGADRVTVIGQPSAPALASSRLDKTLRRVNAGQREIAFLVPLPRSTSNEQKSAGQRAEDLLALAHCERVERGIDALRAGGYRVMSAGDAHKMASVSRELWRGGRATMRRTVA